MFWGILLLFLKELWVPTVNFRFTNQSSIPKSSHGVQPGVWADQSGCSQKKAEAGAAFRVWLWHKQEASAACKNKWEPQCVCNKKCAVVHFMMTWLRVLIIGKHKKANFTEGFSFLSTGFGQSLVQHLLAQSRCSLWAVCQMDTWIKTSGCGKDSVLFVRYQPTSCKAQRQFTPGLPSWPHVSGPSHPFSPH